MVPKTDPLWHLLIQFVYDCAGQGSFSAFFFGADLSSKMGSGSQPVAQPGFQENSCTTRNLRSSWFLTLGPHLGNPLREASGF